jgi:hypothetical protein
MDEIVEKILIKKTCKSKKKKTVTKRIGIKFNRKKFDDEI